MKMKCPECGGEFNAQTALCEDWRDPNKSLGCPHCGTFFIKKVIKNKRVDLIYTLFTVGVLLPAINLIIHQTRGVDIYVLFNALFILISGIVIAYISQIGKPFFTHLTKSPYQKDVKS